MADEFCLKMPDFHVTFRDLLHAVNLRHGTDGVTSFPKEGVLGIFSPWKIRRLRPGLNPRTWVPKASTLPLDHRNRFWTMQVLKVFAATEINEMFSGRHPRQVLNWHFREWLRPHLQGVADGLVERKLINRFATAQGSHSIPRPGRTVIYTTHSRTPIYQFWFYQAISNTLKMGTESVPEWSENLHISTRLTPQEHFIEFFWTIFCSLDRRRYSKRSRCNVARDMAGGGNNRVSGGTRSASYTTNSQAIS